MDKLKEWWENQTKGKKTGIILALIIGAGVLGNMEEPTRGNSACTCLDELDTMRVNSSLYQECVDIAIIAGETSNPYGYFERECRR